MIAHQAVKNSCLSTASEIQKIMMKIKLRLFAMSLSQLFAVGMQ